MSLAWVVWWTELAISLFRVHSRQRCGPGFVLRCCSHNLINANYWIWLTCWVGFQPLESDPHGKNYDPRRRKVWLLLLACVKTLLKSIHTCWNKLACIISDGSSSSGSRSLTKPVRKQIGGGGGGQHVGAQFDRLTCNTGWEKAQSLEENQTLSSSQQ